MLHKNNINTKHTLYLQSNKHENAMQVKLNAPVSVMLLIRKQQLQNVRCYSLINKMHIGVDVLDLGMTTAIPMIP